MPEIVLFWENYREDSKRKQNNGVNKLQKTGHKILLFMAKKAVPPPPVEIPKPATIPEMEPYADAEEPLAPEEVPDQIPDLDPDEKPPYEIPPPGEGP
jgi:hypothetical protein